MKSKFLEIKSEILKRAKEAYACKNEYRKAYGSETIQELMQVVKDNFARSVEKQIIDAELIAEYVNKFNKNNIYCNTDVSRGYLLASGHPTVVASDNSTVIAIDSSTVRVFDTSTVEAWDSSTVKAFNNSYVNTYDNTIECKLSGNAIRRVKKTNVIQTANSEIKL